MTDQYTKAQNIEKAIRLRIAISHLATAVMELHTAYGATSKEYASASNRINDIISELDEDVIKLL